MAFYKTLVSKATTLSTLQNFFSYTIKYLVATLSSLPCNFFSFIEFPTKWSYRSCQAPFGLQQIVPWFCSREVIFAGRFWIIGWLELVWIVWLKLEHAWIVFFLGINPCVKLTQQNTFVKVKFVKIFQKYLLILPFYFIG